MTDDNKQRNIVDELVRSEQCLRAARALLDLALYADAVSRAYYAVFHALRAEIDDAARFIDEARAYLARTGFGAG